MIDVSTRDWLDRFRTVEPLLPSSYPLEWCLAPVDVEGTGDLPLSMWCLEAVDFHCTDVVERVLTSCAQKKVAVSSGMNVERLKQLMWRCSSSVTNKRIPEFARERSGAPQPTTTDELQWALLLPHFRAASKRILQERIKSL